MSFLLIALLTACASSTNSDAQAINTPLALNVIPGQTEKPPEMNLRYSINGELYEVPITSGLSTWTVIYDDGSGWTSGTDALSSLDAGPYLHVIDKNSDITTVEIDFTSPPDSLVVLCWPDKYMENAFEYYDSYEMVVIFDNIVNLSDGDEGYVYDVRAEWSQGYAHYGFRVAGNST